MSPDGSVALLDTLRRLVPEKSRSWIVVPPDVPTLPSGWMVAELVVSGPVAVRSGAVSVVLNFACVTASWSVAVVVWMTIDARPAASGAR